jgi:amino acid transporter
LGGAALTRFQLPTLSLGDWTLDVNLPRDAKGQAKPLFDLLTTYAMFGAILFETLAVAAIFPLRWKYPHAERPYRCWGYPVVPAIYVLLLGLVFLHTCIHEWPESGIGAGIIALGAVVYALIRKA